MKQTATKTISLAAATLAALLLCLPSPASGQSAPPAAAKPAAAPATPQPQPEKKKALPDKSKRYALVVGVDNYADTQISTLGGASNDARALAQSLVNYAGFSADQVILLSSNQPAERQPTRGNILRRLSNLASVVPPDGLLLFAFAGHGIERGGQAFLLPSDAQVSDDVNLLEQTAVNVNQIKSWVKQTGVKQVLLILDACRNDPAGRANADNPLTETYTRAFDFDRRNREVEAFVTLYATSVGHRAYEYKEKKQGYFTYMLVEGMKGAAANEKGEVTLEALVSYLQNRVKKQVELDLGRGKVQKPYAVVEGYKADELVIAAGDGRGLALNTTMDFADEVTTPEKPEEEKGGRGEVHVNLEGTTWTGAGPTGEYTIEFQKEGKLRYLVDGIQNGEKHQSVVPGTWKQVGKTVRILIRGGYSVLDGNMEGGIIRGDAENLEGQKWRFVLLPKDK